MASRFDTDAAATLWDIQLQTFGETVTYTPKATGTPQENVDAIIDRSEYQITEQEWKNGVIRKARVSIAKADVESPVLGDDVIFDGETWHVFEPEENEIHVLGVRRFTLDTQAPQGEILGH